MRAGTMRDKITFQRWDTTSDPKWGPTGGWSDLVTLWASVNPVAGLEKWQGLAVGSEVSHVIRTRWYPGITNKHRIVYRERKLDIVSVIDVEGFNTELLIQAIEHPAEGGADV